MRSLIDSYNEHDTAIARVSTHERAREFFLYMNCKRNVIIITHGNGNRVSVSCAQMSGQLLFTEFSTIECELVKKKKKTLARASSMVFVVPLIVWSLESSC